MTDRFPVPTYEPAAASAAAARHVELARAYLAAIERGDGSASDFFAPEVVQIELPNRLAPRGAVRDLAELREAGERGRKVLTRQRFEVRGAVAAGDRVALELLWVGTLAIPIGSTPVGGEMRAHFGVFLDFRDGKIVGQCNYDCFEEF